jgi:hypothetical protein
VLLDVTYSSTLFSVCRPREDKRKLEEWAASLESRIILAKKEFRKRRGYLEEVVDRTKDDDNANTKTD